MNKSYRVIWNSTTGTWTVAPEICRARGKSTSRAVVAATTALMGALLPNVSHAIAAPGGGYSGLYVNDVSTAGCIVASDASSGSGGGSGNQWYGVNASNYSGQLKYCDASDRAYQTNRVLFYGSTQSPNALDGQIGTDSLTLGGELYVNSGRLGLNNYWTGSKSMAIGNDGTTATGTESIAVGNDASAAGTYAIALGKSAQAAGVQSISIGTGNRVSGNNSGAIGDPSVIDGSDSYSVGNNNVIGAGQTDVFVFGNNISSTISNSVALGSNASMSAAATGATAGTTTYGGDTIKGTAYTYAGASPVGVVSIGSPGAERRIQNVAAGLVAAGSTDAVNGSQLYATNTALNNLVASGGKYFHASSVRADSSATGLDSIAVGPVALASGGGSIAQGISASATNVNAIAIGTGASSSGQYSTALGGNAQALDDNTLAVGNDAKASTNGAIALGTMALGSGANAIALGVMASATGADSLAAGLAASATAEKAVALGFSSLADRAGMNGAHELFSGTGVGSANGAVSVGRVGGERQIINVAGGTQDTDAVNVRQLKASNQQTVNIIGGDTFIDASTGAVTGPFATINGDTYTTVADAITHIDGRVSTVEGSITTINANIANLGDQVTNIDGRVTTLEGGWTVSDGTTGGAIKAGAVLTFKGDGSNTTVIYDDATRQMTVALEKDITVDSVTAGNTMLNTNGVIVAAGPSMTTTGIDAASTKIVNVAAGTASTDAVNVSQLQGVTNIIGGDTYIDSSTGEVKGPFITIGGDTYNTVADAIEGVDLGAVKYDRNSDGSVSYDSITLAGGADGTKITNVAAGDVSETSKDAINGSQLWAVEQNIATLTDTPITFAGNSGSVDKKLGETFSIEGAATTAGTYSGANVSTVVDADGKLQIQIAESPTFTSVTTGDTVMDTNGVTIAGGPSMTTAGIDAASMKIINVAAGTASTDAVNVSQLQGIADAIGGGTTINNDGTITNPSFVINGGDTYT
ncbi:ESPR-type extended signal peptide-containing protein, partial [Uliginosibacterium sp. sgz301328]|uniref:ESPR-type extended signal peptide-containing protein n=1 Tax=Uliginosibacterium sp. sgz301328 TaxID=3243764 RepID=UPI00359E4C6B